MLGKISTSLAWVCLAFIAYATLSPIALRPGLTATETAPVVILERVGAFWLLGFLFSVGHPKRRIFVSAIVFGSAVVLESLQLFAPARDARVIDTAEKLFGGGLGIMCGRTLIWIGATLTRKVLLASSSSLWWPWT